MPASEKTDREALDDLILADDDFSELCAEVLIGFSKFIDGGDIASWFEMAINAWAAQGRPVKGIFAPGPWEQMGTGPAFATAIQMANPASRVVLITGDGSFSSAGALGFYPWIDAGKKWYGIVSRVSSEGRMPSVTCGQLIRKAWIRGVAQ